MKEGRGAVLLALACLASGCDSTPVAPTVVAPGSHHGTTLRLPEERGFVELTNEPEVRDRRSNEATSLVAYFLQPDGKSPLEPAPTDVRFAIDRAKKAPETISLLPEPKADDPVGAGRFASKPGAYQLVRLRGKLNAKIGGQETSTPFEGAR